MRQEEIAVNFGEIWALFKGTDERIKQTNIELSERFKETGEIIKQINIELSEKFKETDEKIKQNNIELSERFRETDEKIKQNNIELSERFRETDEKIKQTNIELSERFKETDARFKETDARFKETDEEFRKSRRELSERFKRTEKMVGKLGGRWGEFVEGLVMPAVVDLFKEQGIDIERVSQRVVSRKNGESMEIDILGENGDYIVVVEVKSRLTNEEVRSFINSLKRFKLFFPDHGDKKVIGAVASIVMREDVARFAYKQGLFIIGQKGDTVKILNDEKFICKTW
jgi:hypothetical protein